MGYRHEDGYQETGGLNMPELVDDGINIILKGENYDLKIDSNRIIYVKTRSSSIFKSINHETPYGMSRDEKKRFLVTFYEQLEYRLKLEQNEES